MSFGKPRQRFNREKYWHSDKRRRRKDAEQSMYRASWQANAPRDDVHDEGQHQQLEAGKVEMHYWGPFSPCTVTRFQATKRSPSPSFWNFVPSKGVMTVLTSASGISGSPFEPLGTNR